MAAKSKRTTHRSTTGTKLYAVRDAKGRFKDIQTYERSHRADLARTSKAETTKAKARKKAGRREYVRVNLRRTPEGVLEAVKFPREGAGLLSSLVDTEGLVELGEEITQVQPGQTVGFLGYASLM